jgi:hypothetical protein
MKNTKIVLAAMLAVLFAVTSCSVGGATEKRMKRSTLFIGIDTSASFSKASTYDDAVKFIAYYIYGHLNGLGGLNEPKNLFVASIGGFSAGEPKSFRPISEFEGKNVEQIEADLDKWLVPEQTITDFNVFFEKVKELIQKKNLVLTPIDIVIVSDGEPTKLEGKSVVKSSIKDINLKSMEYLARTITVRLLYPSPVVADKWEKQVPRKRVRMWPVDNGVMTGWKAKLKDGEATNDQAELWKWMKDNVDFRVRNRIF